MPGWVILAVAIPLGGMLVGAFSMFLEHQRKMAEIATGGMQGADMGLKNEFNTLRESITAHAMSMDENVKQLASRVTALESRVAAVESQNQSVGA